MGRFYGTASAGPVYERHRQVREALFATPPAARALLAWDQSRLAGIAAYSFLWPAVGLTRSLYPKELNVATTYRRRGIGTLLMRSLIEVASEHGCSRVECTADTGSAGSAGLLQQARDTAAAVEDLLPDRGRRQRTAVAQLTRRRVRPGTPDTCLLALTSVKSPRFRRPSRTRHCSAASASPSRADRPVRYVFTDLPVDHHQRAYRRFTCVTQLIGQRRSVTGGVTALPSAAGICR